MFLKRKNKKQNKSAGLAIMSNGLYYLELDVSDPAKLRLLKYEFAGYSNLAIKQGVLVDLSPVKAAIEDLRARIGDFSCPVNIGIPSRDVMIKNAEFTRMETSMIKEAFYWEFEKYFPYPAIDAIYDLTTVDFPGQKDEDENVHILVAAMKRSKIEPLFEHCKNQAIAINSIEPNVVPAFRSAAKNVVPLDSGYILLLAFAHELQLTIGYKDNGLFYRVVPLSLDDSPVTSDEIGDRVLVEIQATLSYVSSLFRDIKIESLILGGDISIRDILNTKLSDALDFKIVTSNPWVNWNIYGAPEESGDSESVIGLAVRDLE